MSICCTNLHFQNKELTNWKRRKKKIFVAFQISRQFKCVLSSFFFIFEHFEVHVRMHHVMWYYESYVIANAIQTLFSSSFRFSTSCDVFYVSFFNYEYIERSKKKIHGTVLLLLNEVCGLRMQHWTHKNRSIDIWFFLLYTSSFVFFVWIY